MGGQAAQLGVYKRYQDIHRVPVSLIKRRQKPRDLGSAKLTFIRFFDHFGCKNKPATNFLKKFCFLLWSLPANCALWAETQFFRNFCLKYKHFEGERQ
jgi:hypothetical protein